MAGLFSVAAIAIASQGGAPPSSELVRLNEIWAHVDNRVVQQLDLMFEDGDFPAATSLLKVQYAYEPNNWDTMTNLGWMLENIDKLGEAREVYKTFIREHPKDANAVFALGYSYFLKREFKETIATLEPSLSKLPTANSYIILAKAYERLDDWKNALRVWEAQAKRFPSGSVDANIKRVKAKIAGG